jgi:YD repeat-containing protein
MSLPENRRPRSFQFDEADRLIALTDGDGRTVHCRYDDRGLLAAVTDAWGQTRTFATSTHLALFRGARLIATVDPHGRVSRHDRDDGGRSDETLPREDAGGAGAEPAAGPPPPWRSLVFLAGPGGGDLLLAWSEAPAPERPRGSVYLYDPKGWSNAWTYDAPRVTTLVYDAKDRLVEVKKANDADGSQ